MNDSRPVQRISRDGSVPVDESRWPATVPAVRQLLDEGLELPAGVTFLVGENGSGKSTLVEAIAVAYGMPPEGGSNQGGGATRPSESPLSEWLLLRRGFGSPRWGFFLRAETMHGYYSFLESLPGSRNPADYELHEMSHGESFLSLLENKLDSPGFYCLDEPEAALSFQSTLAYLGGLTRLASEGAQIVCATHSPVLASLPGAHILELGEWGIRESSWEDLELVRHWRSYLDAPGRYLRHVLAPDDGDDRK